MYKKIRGYQNKIVIFAKGDAMKKRIGIICLCTVLVFASIVCAMTAGGRLAPRAADVTSCDLNKDGIVNTKDILRALKYIKAPNQYQDKSAFDANGDGAVNNSDINVIHNNLGQSYEFDVKVPNYSDVSTVVPFLPNYSTADTYFVVVQGSGTSCTLYAYSINNGQLTTEFSCTGYLGRNGVCEPENKFEGDGKTPAGIYSMGECFGVSSAPCTVPRGYTKVTSDDYWDSNSNSSTYNQHVKGYNKDSAWHRAGLYEHLINYTTSYAYATMINYNVNPAVPYKGSAIFLHCTVPNDTSSSGCIAIPNSYMKKALALMEDEVYIAIVANKDDLAKYVK